MIKITDVICDYPCKSIFFKNNKDEVIKFDDGDYYAPSVIVYHIYSEKLILADQNYNTLCLGFQKVKDYVELHGNKDIAFKFEKFVFDLLS